MQPTRIEKNATGLCRAVLDGVTQEVLVVGPSLAVIDGLVAVLGERETAPTVRLLATESVLKEAVSEFTDASVIADLVADGSLSLRTSDERLDGPLLVTDGRVVSLVTTDERTAGLATEDAEFVGAARNEYADRWTDAEAFSLRTPPLSRVQETLEDEFGAELADDFERMRIALAETTGDLNEVDVSLLAAARNEALLYDISTWGENVGIASRATFSRKKTHLEECGLIATEKVPIDVGRPRLRLLLGDERLREADADEIVSVAAELLAATQ
jgi:transposase